MQKNPMLRRGGVAAFVLSGFALAACGGEEIAGLQIPTQPSFSGTGESIPHQVSLCKIGPDGTTATFDISGAPSGVGTFPSGPVVTLQSTSLTNPDLSKCAVIWASASPSDPTVAVTTTEREQPGLDLYQIVSFSMDGTQTIEDPASPSHTVNANYDNGALVLFKNTETDVPPPPPGAGGQGCTPGYWKQSQHFGSWTAPYGPTTPFSNVFADAFPGLTLLNVLNLEGGNLNALGRHAVAALLNAASPFVSYDVSTTDVINSFNNAFMSGNKNSIQGAKNAFEGLNEQGCPLGRDEG